MNVTRELFLFFTQILLITTVHSNTLHVTAYRISLRMNYYGTTTWFVLFNVAIPPRIRSHPQKPKDVVFGEPVTFTIQASGTKPLSYQWQWKPATKDGESEAWQPCDVEGHDSTSATLSIPSVLKSNEGRYRCIVNNIAGTKISEPVKLSIGKSQDITACVPDSHAYHRIRLSGAHCYLATLLIYWTS